MTKHNDTALAQIVVGNTTLQIEIPASLHQIISEHGQLNNDLKLYTHSAEALAEILRNFVPPEYRPPTAWQESYMQSIAQTLNIDIPDDARTTGTACSAFIDAHRDAFDIEKSHQRAFIILFSLVCGDVGIDAAGFYCL